LGDLQSLRSKNRRVVRLHLAGDVHSGLDRLSKLVDAALEQTQTTGAGRGVKKAKSLKSKV
ncbi:MAG: hypothetical protein DMG27_15195, partial [Acidobacteria bacterium]